MDDLLVNSLNLTRDFHHSEFNIMDDSHHAEKLKRKMERHDNDTVNQKDA